MKITNKYNLPEPIVTAVTSGLRKPVNGIISVTELISPPQIRALKIAHWDNITVDVSDRLWALLGSAVHYVLDKGASASHLTEERMGIAHLSGWLLTGQPDMLDNSGTLHDYKVTSVYSFLLGDKTEWEAQLNCYAHLYRAHGFEIKKLQINALLRDWQASKTVDADYPPCAFIVKEIPLWSAEKTEQYINDRFFSHAQATHGNVPDCTPEERWHKPDVWAVKKAGNKTALRGGLHDSLMAAEAFAAGYGGKTEIEHRPGADVRCERYCDVAAFCPQLKKELQEVLK